LQSLLQQLIHAIACRHIYRRFQQADGVLWSVLAKQRHQWHKL
jgi:hypothetical protein